MSRSHLVHHAAGLTSDYCDTFVCTSSPAVEQNLRALTRDLTRLNTWTISLFAKDVQYQVSEHSQQLKCTSTCVLSDPGMLSMRRG